jgi:pimeloyl-ACP methyl ester carboxylesterase
MRLSPILSLLACAGLLSAAAPARAQTSPALSSKPFGVIAPAAGVKVGEAECARLEHAVWVVVDGQGECARYWLSEAGGPGDLPILYMSGDQIVSGPGNMPGPGDDDRTLSPAQLQISADNWSKRYGGTYVMLARPGTFGSSGKHGDRRLIREVRIIDAALTALREKHGFLGFHLVGQSGGGHLVASLLPRRRDIACAVIASGAVSVKTRLKDLGRTIDTTGHKNPYDPIDDVQHIQPRKSLRVLMLTDEEDKAVSSNSQKEYADTLDRQGVNVHQFMTNARRADPPADRQAGERGVRCRRGASPHPELVEGRGFASLRTSG